MLGLFSPLEIAVVLVFFGVMVAVAAGVVYVIYRLMRRAARDGARDAAEQRDPRR